MSSYGVQPTGFVRKPLNVILAEIEASMITEFGPDVIQTSQSPFGQINGLMADLAAELWEKAEDIYQSYDPDQAEGNRLDTLGRIRLASRGAADDESYRKAITNAGQARVDVQDLARALAGLNGVTFYQVFVNDSFDTDNFGLERGTIAAAVIGGNDQEIAETLRTFVAPGINTYGNTEVTSTIDGFCRSMNIIRPIEVELSLDVKVRLLKDQKGCPPPSLTAIRDAIAEDWLAARYNGLQVSHFTIRGLIESRFGNVELISLATKRLNEPDEVAEQLTDIAFVEIANLENSNITVTSQ